MSVREINKAMAAHGAWKIRLREAIESGTSEYSPEIVAVDKVCEFGKWLYSISTSERSNPYWPEVQQLHKQFHEEAGRILKLALNGNQDEALNLTTAFDGKFVTTSIALTNKLNDWKKTLSTDSHT